MKTHLQCNKIHAGDNCVAMMLFNIFSLISAAINGKKMMSQVQVENPSIKTLIQNEIKKASIMSNVKDSFLKTLENSAYAPVLELDLVMLITIAKFEDIAERNEYIEILYKNMTKSSTTRCVTKATLQTFEQKLSAIEAEYSAKIAALAAEHKKTISPPCSELHEVIYEPTFAPRRQVDLVQTDKASISVETQHVTRRHADQPTNRQYVAFKQGISYPIIATEHLLNLWNLYEMRCNNLKSVHKDCAYPLTLKRFDSRDGHNYACLEITKSWAGSIDPTLDLMTKINNTLFEHILPHFNFGNNLITLGSCHDASLQEMKHVPVVPLRM